MPCFTAGRPRLFQPRAAQQPERTDRRRLATETSTGISKVHTLENFGQKKVLLIGILRIVLIAIQEPAQAPRCQEAGSRAPQRAPCTLHESDRTQSSRTGRALYICLGLVQLALALGILFTPGSPSSAGKRGTAKCSHGAPSVLDT